MRNPASCKTSLLAGLAAAAILLPSCTHPPLPGPDEKLDIRFTIGSASAAKATGVTDQQEKDIVRWAVFVFNPSGEQVAYGTADASAGIVKSLAPGTYDVCAVVNYPVSGTGTFTPSAINTKSALEGTVSYLRDNTPDALVMYGSKRYTIVSGDNGTKGIPVYRLAAKIGLKKITVDFSGQPALAAKSFILKGIYVTNAYASGPLGADLTADRLSAAASDWYNRMGRSSDREAGFLLCETDLDTPIPTDGGSHTVEHRFYCYPNPTLAGDDRRDAAWSKRCTRLVIEAEVGGTVYYYPITIASATRGIERNNMYIADEVVIRRIGSADPENENPDAVSVRWSAPADGWDDGYSVSENS